MGHLVELTPWSNRNEVENIQNNSNLEVCDFCGNENDKTKKVDIRKNLTIVKVCQIDYFQNENVEGGLISEGLFHFGPSSTKMFEISSHYRKSKRVFCKSLLVHNDCQQI